MNKVAFISLFGLACFACVQATVEDKVSKTTEVSLPNLSATLGLPPNVTVPKTTVQQTEPLDLSDALSKVGQVGTLSLSVYQNTLASRTGDFSFIDELKVVLTPDSNNASGLPPVTMVDVVLTPDQKNSSTIDVPILMSGDDLVKYFSSGALVAGFSFTLEGVVPTTGLDVENTIGLDVSVNVNKSVSDIGK